MEGLLKNCIVLSLGLHVLEFYMFCMFLQFQFVCMDPFVDFVSLLTTGEILAQSLQSCKVNLSEIRYDQVGNSWWTLSAML